MGQYGMTDAYEEKFQASLQYQDFVSDQLRKKYGIILGIYSSYEYQIQFGESASGIEVKYDRRMAETGNIYIETHEKTRPENPEFVKSGIYREDGTWAWLIGDYEKAFLFAKNQLIHLHQQTQFYEMRHIKEVENPTSKGILLPAKVAIERLICIRQFTF